MDRLGTKSEDGQKTERPVPAGRLGDVRDVANATVFLFSDAASYITGQVIVVDGGDEHISGAMLPYPRAVLDPQSVKKLITPRL